MILTAILLLAPPDLSALDRFPTLAQANSQLAALIGVRHTLRQAPPTPEREQAIRENARQLLAWELLLTAHGGLGLEENGNDSEPTRRNALERLRLMLSEKEWRAGRMP